MKFHHGLVALLLSFPAMAQQGLVPLSSVVDAPWSARMHQFGVEAHSAIRPYFRADLPPLAAKDSVQPAALLSWLGHLADPSRKFSAGPVLDALAGASLNEAESLKYRTGAGAWLAWNPGPRWSLGLDGEAWSEALPDYLDQFATAYRVVPGEGRAQWQGKAINHFDWNGHVDYKAGDYFHFTLGKGRHFIGEGYRSLFLSDEATGYPFLKITTTAWRFRYINLFTLMNDIRGSGGDPARFMKKFTSMHYLSWNISKRVNAGLFEAIVWQDNDPKYPRGFDLSYINPVIFYRPVEFGLGSPDNALLGFALNVKVGRKAMLYSQLMLDEFLLTNVRAGQGWYGNKQGVQAGAVLHDAFCRKGLLLRAEVNYVRPFMYTHSDTRQNYAHYGQPLAHPYGSGLLEGLLQGEWRRGRWLLGNIFSYAVMGRDTADGHGSFGNNIFLSDNDRPYWRGSRMNDFGYYLGEPEKEVVAQNELRIGWLVEPRSGMMLELAWTWRRDHTEHAAPLVTNYLRAGLSTNLHGRHPFQAVRR